MSCFSSNIYDIIADQGATFQRHIVLKTTAKKPITFGLHTGLMQIRTRATSPVILLELSTENGLIKLDGTKGLIELYISAAVMTEMPAGDYVYDLDLTETETSEVTTVLQGEFTVRAEVTR
jgi:hypothetical protein